MSFSQQIKSELCSTKFQCKHCKKAAIYGMLFMSKTVTSNTIIINTENREVAQFLADGITEFSGVITTLVFPKIQERKKRPIYVVSVDNPEDVKIVLNVFFKTSSTTPINKNSISFGLFHDYCCQNSFLRGVYCIVGTTINPKKEYHFEFCLPNQKICSQMYIMISQMSDDTVEIKQTLRNNSFILYIKDSQQIEDILVYLGAVKCSMDLMNTKIEKQLRNSVNRRTNCETANIDKTVNASVLQVQKINHIIKTKGIDFLKPELKEVAKLRLSNPDMSLTELCSVADFQISRSGLNHRLKKICDLSDNLEWIFKQIGSK